MNAAILPNPNDELELVTLQKSLIENINKPLEENCVFPFFPLFIELNSPAFSSKKLSEIKKEIENVQIQPHTIQDNKIYFPVSIKLKDGKEYREKLIIGTTKTTISQMEAVGNNTSQNFIKSLKVFRLCELKKSGFQTEIWNPLWVKLS